MAYGIWPFSVSSILTDYYILWYISEIQEKKTVDFEIKLPHCSRIKMRWFLVLGTITMLWKVWKIGHLEKIYLRFYKMNQHVADFLTHKINLCEWEISYLTLNFEEFSPCIKDENMIFFSIMKYPQEPQGLQNLVCFDNISIWFYGIKLHGSLFSVNLDIHI